MDAFAVDVEPAADLAERLLELRLDRAVALRTHVHEEVAATRGDLDEVGDDVGAGLAALEVRIPRPLPAEGHARLPREEVVVGRDARIRRGLEVRADDRGDLLEQLFPVVLLDEGEDHRRVHGARVRRPTGDRLGHGLLGREEVGPEVRCDRGRQAAEAVVHQDVGLVLADPAVEPLDVPLRAEADVPPPRVEVAVLGAQLLDLALHAIEEAGPLGTTGLAEEVLREGAGAVEVAVVVEVGCREVGAEADACVAARTGDLADDIATERRVGRLVVGGVGVEETETVVVLGGEDQVALAGVAGEFGPLGGVESLGRHLLRQRLVLLERHRLDRHLDLARAETMQRLDEPSLQFGAEHDGPRRLDPADGIRTPVDEQSELGVVELRPLASPVAHGDRSYRI